MFSAVLVVRDKEGQFFLQLSNNLVGSVNMETHKCNKVNQCYD